MIGVVSGVEVLWNGVCDSGCSFNLLLVPQIVDVRYQLRVFVNFRRVELNTFVARGKLIDFQQAFGVLLAVLLHF